MHTPRADAAGQIMPLVALFMVVLLGMAALAVDGSNLYAQHRRLQADLDVAVTVAGAAMFDYDPSSAAYTSTATQAITSAATLLERDGYANTIATSPATTVQAIGGDYHNGFCGQDTAAGLTLCTPPRSGLFAGPAHADYVEGTLSRTVGGFFGGVLGLGTLHISVRAVAWHGGFHQPYALIGLDPTPGACSIAIQNTSSDLVVNGNIMANAQSCIKQGAATVYGRSDAHAATTGSNGTQITGQGGTMTNVPPIDDPYDITALDPTQAESVTSYSPPAGTTTGIPPACQAEFAHYIGAAQANSAYFVPPLDGQPALIAGFDVANGAYYFLPRCDGTPTGASGVYYFSHSPYDMHISGGGASVNSFNSVFVFDPSNAPIKDDGNAIWVLRAPQSAPYQGIAVTELRPCSTLNTMTLTGNAGSLIDGVIDMPCSNVTITGSSSSNFIDGAVVGYDVTVAGNGTEIVSYDPAGTPPDKGSVLVE